jgi:hypothetical protein
MVFPLLLKENISGFRSHYLSSLGKAYRGEREGCSCFNYGERVYGRNDFAQPVPMLAELEQLRKGSPGEP